jgi:hypothetical protein
MGQLNQEIQFFNLVDGFKEFEKFKSKMASIFSLLPEYHDHVSSVGVFLAHKSDMKTRVKAIEYTKNPDSSELNKNPYAYLMMTFFYKGIQSIVVFRSIDRGLCEGKRNQCATYSFT